MVVSVEDESENVKKALQLGANNYIVKPVVWENFERNDEKIFQVFDRLHTPEEFEATGIGLAIVKKSVGKLGGLVRVESAPGTGSTFFVTLPKSQEEQEQ